MQQELELLNYNKLYLKKNTLMERETKIQETVFTFEHHEQEKFEKERVEVQFN